MTKRQALATGTLAALPTVMMTAQTTALTSSTAHAAMQWGWAFGLEGYESVAWNVIGIFACLPFAGPGAIACGIAGVA